MAALSSCSPKSALDHRRDDRAAIYSYKSFGGGAGFVATPESMPLAGDVEITASELASWNINYESSYIRFVVRSVNRNYL